MGEPDPSEVGSHRMELNRWPPPATSLRTCETRRSGVTPELALETMPNDPHLTSQLAENGPAVAAVGVPRPGLLTQKEAAAYLRVSPAYLRASSCPKILLPGNGKKGRPMVRYRVEDRTAWAERRFLRHPRSA
jgi:hypothetical protein